MKPRDRLVLTVVGMAGVLAAIWFLAVAPKRDEAKTASAQISSAETRRDNAVATATTAEQAKATYGRDYSTVARLGKAVPAKADVPSLVFQLESAAKAAKVDFRSISVAADVAAAAPAPAATTAKTKAGETAPASETPTTPAPATSAAGIAPKGFSFNFRGHFLELRRLLAAIDRFSRVKGSKVSVSGRLLTIDSVALNPAPEGLPDVVAVVKANAYVAPIPAALPGASSPQASTAAPTTTTASQVAP